MARIKVKEEEFSIEQAAKRVRGETHQKTGQETESPPKARRNRPKIVITPGRVVISGLTIVLLGVGAFAYSVYQQREDLREEITTLKTDPAIIARQQNEQLLTRVGRLVELPPGETPTIADVTDAQKARAEDDFYQDARNGDKVLFYPQAGKAILYRPSSNKVIMTAPISRPQP